jgi:formamidopyrimidine-DNA glycosylase
MRVVLLLLVQSTCHKLAWCDKCTDEGIMSESSGLEAKQKHCEAWASHVSGAATVAVVRHTQQGSEAYHSIHRHAAALEHVAIANMCMLLALLQETGRGDYTDAAMADGSSWQCPHCSGVVAAQRQQAHLAHWCPALQQTG